MLVTDEWKQERLKRAYAGELNIPKHMNRATQALFWEFRNKVRWKERDIIPQYNLSFTDHDDTLSMRQIYMQCTTEYEAAMVLLGRWDHWEKLCNTPWFPKHIEKWRAEKAARDGDLGRSKIVEAAQAGNLNAAKYLDQESKVPQPKRKKKPAEAKLSSSAGSSNSTDWAEEALARAKE